MMIRRLIIIAALCLCSLSASAALSMQECRAKYKAEQAAKTLHLAWAVYQEKICGIDGKAAPTPPATATKPRH